MLHTHMEDQHLPKCSKDMPLHAWVRHISSSSG